MLEFREVNSRNYKRVLRLKVSESQKGFVSDNTRSLAQCYIYRDNGDVFPYAVYDDEDMVGFLLLERGPEEGYVLIWRLMIDENHQKKGYGRRVIQKVIDTYSRYPEYSVINTDTAEGNYVMERLVASMGFTQVGYDEEMMEKAWQYRIR